MATWDAGEPAIGKLANTIHTLIQVAKEDIRELMEVTNGDAVKEHNIYGSDEDGVHASSRVGFVRISTWANKLTSGLKEGSLHYFTDSPNIGLFIIDASLDFVRIGTLSHSSLENLTDVDCHLGLLRLDGGNQMSTELRVKSSGSIAGIAFPTTDSDDALNPTHVAETWHSAHGDDSINSRHIPDVSLKIEDGDLQVELEIVDLPQFTENKTPFSEPVDDLAFTPLMYHPLDFVVPFAWRLNELIAPDPSGDPWTLEAVFYMHKMLKDSVIV